MENRSIKNAESAVHKYAGTVDFENNQKNRQSIGSDLNNLRNLQKCVTDFTESAAKSAAESIFRNDTKTINAKEPYTIEYLLHTADEARAMIEAGADRIGTSSSIAIVEG